MKQIVLNIKDDSKISLLRDFLKAINFIEVAPEIRETAVKERGNFEDLFGIWKDRDISIEKIRSEAWVKR